MIVGYVAKRYNRIRNTTSGKRVPSSVSHQDIRPFSVSQQDIRSRTRFSEAKSNLAESLESVLSKTENGRLIQQVADGLSFILEDLMLHAPNEDKISYSTSNLISIARLLIS